MGVLPLDGRHGETGPGIPSGAPREVPGPTRDRGGPGERRRPWRELREGGNRVARPAFVPYHELQFTGGDGCARICRVDCAAPRTRGPSRPLETETGQECGFVGLRKDLRGHRDSRVVEAIIGIACRGRKKVYGTDRSEPGVDVEESLSPGDGPISHRPQRR